MKPWTVTQPHKIYFTPNKTLRVESNRLENYEEWSKSISLIEQVEEWKRRKLRNDILSVDWKRVNQLLVNTSLYQDLLQCDCGTIIYTPVKAIVNGIDIYQGFGQEGLFKYGTIYMSELEIYMAKGFLTKSELSNYRKIIDVRLKYTIMQIQTEEIKNEYYRVRQNHLSIISRK